MISIIKHSSKCKKLKPNSDYSLYINDTLKLDFEHFREPEDLAQLLRDAAIAVDLSNGIKPPTAIVQKTKPKPLTMLERMNRIQDLQEKQEMDY